MPYLQVLLIFATKLGKNPSLDEGAQNFRSLLQKAIQEQRMDELSDDSMTRSVLREIQKGCREGRSHFVQQAIIEPYPIWILPMHLSAELPDRLAQAIGDYIQNQPNPTDVPDA